MSSSFNKGNPYVEFSQELFTTQDLQGFRNQQGHQNFFQSQIRTQLHFSKNQFQEGPSTSANINLSFNNSFEHSQSSNIESETYSSISDNDDAIFNISSQASLHNDSQTSSVAIATQSFNYNNSIITHATTNSSLTINYDSKESIDKKIPESITNLYSEIKQHYSDWTFVTIIIGQLCNEKFPMGTYHNLKLALILSLITPSSSPMHIMAIGSETSNANIIMNELGDFAERFVPFTNKTADGVVIKKDGTCQAGPLVLASQGVSFVGYWQQLKPKIKIQFIREIETNSLLVQKVQKHIALESTVWAHWNCTKKIKKDIAALDQFVNVFGIPIIIDEKLDREKIVFDLIDQLSVNPTKKFEGYNIPKEDMRIFLNIIKQQATTFDPQAEALLKKYFTATNIIRKHVITQKGIEMLRKMSEAHAKLCLRSNVMRQDVLAAIGICECFIKTLYDTDAYSSPNKTTINTIEDIDAFQSKMFEWLTCFTHDILEKL